MLVKKVQNFDQNIKRWSTEQTAFHMLSAFRGEAMPLQCTRARTTTKYI